MLALAIELNSEFDMAQFISATNKQINQAKKYALSRTTMQLKKTIRTGSAEHLGVVGKAIGEKMSASASADTRKIEFDKNATRKVINLSPRATASGVRASNRKTYKDTYIGTRGRQKQVGVYKRRGEKMPQSLYVYLGAAVEFEMDEAAERQAFKIFNLHFSKKLNELIQ